MTCLSSPQVLKYYSTMAEAVARRLEQLRSRAGVQGGDGEVLLRQLRGGTEPRLARTWDDITVLHNACHVPRLVRTWYCFTLVHYACRHGWLDFVKSLIREHSCDPHAVTHDEETPLHCACRHGRFDIVHYLISEQHCDPDCCDSDQQTPLHWACQHGRFDIVRYLISEQHCDPDCCDSDQQTPLHLVSGAYRECTQEEAVKIVKFLVSLANCDVSKRDKAGDTALHIACRHSQAGQMVIHCLTHCCHVPVVCINNYCNENLITILEHVVRGACTCTIL